MTVSVVTVIVSVYQEESSACGMTHIVLHRQKLTGHEYRKWLIVGRAQTM